MSEPVQYDHEKIVLDVIQTKHMFMRYFDTLLFGERHYDWELDASYAANFGKVVTDNNIACFLSIVTVLLQELQDIDPDVMLTFGRLFEAIQGIPPDDTIRSEFISYVAKSQRISGKVLETAQVIENDAMRSELASYVSTMSTSQFKNENRPDGNPSIASHVVSSPGGRSKLAR